MGVCGQMVSSGVIKSAHMDIININYEIDIQYFIYIFVSVKILYIINPILMK